MYNFQVEDHHTYYVGENSILVHNAEDYIKANRVPLDYKGKDGNYYYRDTLHAGKSAHLEVFDKRGNHVGEANVETGIIDYFKANPRKHLNVK